MYRINRKAYYGLVHKGINALLKDRLGFVDDDEYRNYLGLRTGKKSCKDLDDVELYELVQALKQEGYIQPPKKSTYVERLGGSGSESGSRPTRAQWAKLAALAREKGWSKVLNDPALDAFVERTTGLKHAKWLTRAKMTEVILGLERWIAGG